MIETLASWHPFLVHFAVALSLTSAAFDIADFFFRKPRFVDVGFTLMLTAIPFLLAAVLTGNLAASFITTPRELKLLAQHETYANITVWVFTGAGFWRVFLSFKEQYRDGRKILYVFLITLAATSAYLAAKKGGSIMHPASEETNAPVVVVLGTTLQGLPSC